MAPVVLDRCEQAELYRAAEAVAAIHDEVASLCREQPDLLSRFFDLPPAHRAMWEVGGPEWHGIARADVFRTTDGLKVCELNSDTPSGQPEAVALGRVFGGDAISAPAHDPNHSLEQRIADLLHAAAGRVAAGRAMDPDDARARQVGILYATEVTDELCVIELYARWFEARGFRVVLGSPYNLRPDGDGGVSLFGVSCPVIWRNYKTDWWGERRRIWNSAPEFLDAAPLAEPLSLLLDAVARGRCAVINPFGAVVTQNKRAMALMWEQLDQFSSRARAAIRRYVPYTARLEALSPRRLRAERARWVLKSDYGCEGEEVIVGLQVSDRAWASALADARAGRWIAQLRFSAAALDAGGLVPNFGVYVVAGRACGLYTRLQQGATDRRALSAASLVRLP
jgi:glutathionylspermidine synthase